jgi:hypothetical protein
MAFQNIISPCLKPQGVMEYDSNENIWTIVASLPETLIRISCCVAWCDRIFVCCYAESVGQACYMFDPPPIKSADGVQVETSLNWAAIERWEDFHVDYVQRILCVITFEI